MFLSPMKLIQYLLCYSDGVLMDKYLFSHYHIHIKLNVIMCIIHLYKNNQLNILQVLLFGLISLVATAVVVFWSNRNGEVYVYITGYDRNTAYDFIIIKYY